MKVYFQVMKVYFQALKIYFQGLKILFETGEIYFRNVLRQLLKIPRFGMIEGCSLKLLRALRFFLKSFYFFLNRIARYAQSKELEIFLRKFRKSPAKQFLEIAYKQFLERS